MRRPVAKLILTLGLIAGQVAAQVSLVLLSDSAESIELTEGQVEFDLAVHVDTTIDLDGIVFGLQASDPELFVLGDPPVVHGGPFAESELITEEPVAGMSLSDGPELGYFRVSGMYAAAEFTGPLATFRIRSAAPLPAGTSYTFTTGDNGSEYLWALSPDFDVFDSPGQLTLNIVEVTPDPEPEPEPDDELTPQERLANLLPYLRAVLLIWILLLL